MKKGQSIITLAVIFLVIAGLGLLAVFGIGADKSGAASNIKKGLDLAGGVSITYQVVGDEEPSEEDMQDTINKLQQRIEKYSTESQVYQEGTDRINIEIPGVSDANTILEELGQPGTLYFIAQTDSEGNENYTGNFLTGYTLSKTIDELEADGSIVLVGTDVASASAQTTQDDLNNSESVVSLTLTDEGAAKFATATEKAFSADESIAIYYDGEFISVPGVDAVISDGQAVISGMTDFAAAEKLASQIRIGGLKLELEELRSNVVGAQLGQEAIRTSLLAAAIGIGLVIIFMVVLFNVPGLCASFGLLMYVGLMIFLLNAFEITLTLPGIAGIILSIGMAVDANVIIYTRIREEIGNGKTVKSAIDSGYHKALSAIIDGNLTTVIAAIVLGLKGTGSIRGFAITLGLGVCLSMFTALTISRLIMKAFFAIGIKDEKWYGSKVEKKPFDFIKIGGVSLGICIALIIGGFVVMGVNGGRGVGAMNYSLEFMGGTSTNITFNEDLTIAELEADVIPVFADVVGEGDIQKQKVTGTNQVIVKTRTLTQDEREVVTAALTEKFGIEESAIQTESISSTIGKEMRRDAMVAVAIAIVCMLAYIWLRFKDIRFASSAVLALLYDVLIVVAFYAVSRISVGGTFIACLLTLIGYSINNTIIIFDRIREHLHEMKKKDDYKELVNRSITQTTTRCIYSSTTVLITIVMLYILGVPAVKDFALPLIVGIVFGTFTSVFVTGPMWYFFRTKIVKKVK